MTDKEIYQNAVAAIRLYQKHPYLNQCTGTNLVDYRNMIMTEECAAFNLSAVRKVMDAAVLCGMAEKVNAMTYVIRRRVFDLVAEYEDCERRFTLLVNDKTRAVWDYIALNGQTGFDEICQSTGLTRPAVSSICYKLRVAGMVEYYDGARVELRAFEMTRFRERYLALIN